MKEIFDVYDNYEISGCWKIGERFTGSYEASDRIRIMHAAQALLDACRMVVDRWEQGDLGEAARACEDAIVRATTHRRVR